MTSPAAGHLAPGGAASPAGAGAAGHSGLATVVVGIDGSANSRAALRFAAHEAALRQAALVVVQVLRVGLEHLQPPPQVRAGDGMGLLAMLAASPFADATLGASPPVHVPGVDHRLVEIVEQELGAAAAQTAATETWQGRPARALVDRSTGAAMLVVGARGRGGFGGLLLGSTADQVLHRARCPVTVVHRTEGGGSPAGKTAPVGAMAPSGGSAGAMAASGEPVVVGVDAPSTPSRAMLDVLRLAADEAALRQAPLEVLVVRSTGSDAEGADAAAGVSATPAPDRAATVRNLVEQVSGHRDLAVSVVVSSGRPAAALVERSRHASLMVIGARHRGPAGREAASVHGQVVRHASCPVVVLRPGHVPGSR